MNYQDLNSLVLSRFQTGFSFVGVQVEYPNQGRLQHSGNWVRVTVLHGSGFQAAMGDPDLHRRFGVLVCSVFTPVGVGQGTAFRIADTIVPLFTGKFELIAGEGYLRYQTPYVEVDGVVDSVWYSLRVLIPFSWDSFGV